MQSKHRRPELKFSGIFLFSGHFMAWLLFYHTILKMDYIIS
jgi:hypothetical protein